MNALELRATLALAAVFFLRMLALFMLLPVLPLYAEHLPGATPLLIGVAMGAYGATQAVLQIPLGRLSDRIGRKPIIVGGLLVFAAGSLLASTADSIWSIIVGRLLQGAGAIASAVMAFAADVTGEENRTKSMAIIGASIGVAFLLAFALGPFLAGSFDLQGVFIAAALMALVGIVALLWGTRGISGKATAAATQALPTMTVLSHPALLRLDFGIFSLHLVLTGSFVVLPVLLRDVTGVAPAEHWQVYLSAMLASVALMVPAVMVADRPRLATPIYLGAIALLGVGLGLIRLGADHGMLAVTAAMTLYFAAFNFLESNLPARVSRAAPAEAKGAALGAFSTAQFIGIFCGGVLGGWLRGSFSMGAALLGLGLLCLLWLAIAATDRRTG